MSVLKKMASEYGSMLILRPTPLWRVTSPWAWNWSPRVFWPVCSDWSPCCRLLTATGSG